VAIGICRRRRERSAAGWTFEKPSEPERVGDPRAARLAEVHERVPLAQGLAMTARSLREPTTDDDPGGR
jgi:hypothetical protein